jgi:hypothetical protein
MTMAMTKPVDERTATSIRVPGSGASTAATGANKPATVANPPDQRSAPNDSPQAAPPAQTSVRPERTQGTVPADFDFEIRKGTPRSASAEAMSTDNPPPETTQTNAGQAGPRPNDLPSTMRIKFRGEDREYPVDTIRQLAQQGLAVGENSPVLGVINEIKRQTGISDPRKLAELVMTAVQRIVQQQGANGGGNGAMPPNGGGNGMMPPNGAGGADVAPVNPLQAMAGGAPAAAAAARVAAQAASRPFALPPPNPNAEQDMQALEQMNGLQFPDGARSALMAMFKHGNALDTMVGTYGGLVQQVQKFQQDLQMRSQQALQSAVNAEAARVATELGIDTPEEVAGFAKFIGETDSEFPGFKQRVLQDPRAMGSAIRKYYEVAAGRRAIAERKDATQRVSADLARAGGEMASPRPGGGMIPGAGGAAGPNGQIPEEDFNRTLMDKMM